MICKRARGGSCSAVRGAREFRIRCCSAAAVCIPLTAQLHTRLLLSLCTSLQRRNSAPMKQSCATLAPTLTLTASNHRSAGEGEDGSIPCVRCREALQRNEVSE